MLYFRIEDISGFGDNPRTYDLNSNHYHKVKKEDIDIYIADLIRKEVNGSKFRTVFSYSKSLAACLFKYNPYVDNELHIFDCDLCDFIVYISQKNNNECRWYSINDRLSCQRFFNKNGFINLTNFVIDISDNRGLNRYLQEYTGVGLKKMASPQKDCEVIVMHPFNDLVLYNYLNSIYVLYALQLKYHFLNDYFIRCSLINRIWNMDSFRFMYYPNERLSLICIINYLSQCWEFEKDISQKIYEYSKNESRTPPYYDSILQFHGILEDDIDDSIALSDYNGNVISDLFFEYCNDY